MRTALPRDNFIAHITLLPNECKYPTPCQNYGSISLINEDLKLFTKTLVMRLVPWIPDQVHLVQVGFLPTREAKDNVTKALNAIHTARSRSTLMMLLSTDADKAFELTGPLWI